MEHRTEPRESLQVPVLVGDGLEAITRDVSPSGMYFEIRGDHHELDGTLFFEMHLEEPRMKFTSEGRIVRIEHRDGRTGVAVKLISPQLEAME